MTKSNYLRCVFYGSLLIVTLLTMLLRLSASIAHSQTNPSLETLPFPYTIFPGLDNFKLGTTRLQDMQSIFQTIGGRLDYLGSGPDKTLRFTPNYYGHNIQTLNNSLLNISLTTRQDKIVWTELQVNATYDKSLNNHIPRNIWLAVSPKTMIELYGPPDAFSMGVNETGYDFGISFRWNNIQTEIGYYGVLADYDMSWQVFKICPRRDRISYVIVKTVSELNMLDIPWTQAGTSPIPISDASRMGFLVNDADKNSQAITNILLQEGCFSTKATAWGGTFDPNYPTWTPWPIFTETPTPIDQLTLTSTVTSTYTETSTPISTLTETPTSTTTSTSTATSTSTPTATLTLAPTSTAGLLRLQYYPDPGRRSITVDSLEPDFRIMNPTSSSIPLSEFKIRYYFAKEGTSPLVFTCWYVSSPLMCSKVTDTAI